MKLKLLYTATAVLVAHLTTAQVLYTEDFDNLTVGNLSNDPSGNTPGQGGWYPKIISNNTSDFLIEPEPGRGNVLTVKRLTSPPLGPVNWLLLKDLQFSWKQRIAGHDILKLSFDYYAGVENNNFTSKSFGIGIYADHGNLVNYYHNAMDGWIRGGLPVAQDSQSMGGNTHLGYGSDLMFPSNIWVTLELFIDYTADKVYFSIPSMNFVRVFDTNFFLSLTNPVSPEDPKNDEPVGIHISNSIDIAKVDNFSIEALNQIPLNIQEWVSSKFNVFPNPVTDVVTITNSSNIGIEELT